MTEVCQKSRNLKINLSQINKNDTFNDDGSNQSNKSINLVFNNISYSVWTNILSKKRKQLLFDISGDFRSGELTAIIGPSGAGKSTMMDILAGFTTSSVTGNIIVNGENRDLASFRRSSAYIMQDDNLQLLLTVQEAMDCAANLKLNTSASEKKHTVDEILVAMGLSKCRKTRTDKLSGGQRKRLVIALELVNNPPIMFFDEPTSGLDSVSSKQCLAFLKMLAREGRTIICTIHQPSATLFDMIDHLYVVSQGKCLYTGGTKNLVNFLASFQLNCPTYHNPADFILEICNGDYGDHLLKLVNSIENGKSNCWRSPTEDDLYKIEQLINENIMTPIVSPNLPTPAIFMKNKINGSNHATGFWMQLCILLRQNFIRLSRDRVLTYMRLSMHLIIAILVGIIFFNIGEDATYALDNYNLLFFNVMFLMFSAFSATLITFPLEVPVLTREHFNRWYKLRSFYLANKLADLPIQITATIIYTLTVYYMSGQVNEVKRLALYIFICIAISLVAQKIGLIVGIAMKLQNGVIFGPLFIMPFTIFSGFFIHMNDAQPFLQWLFHISFIKYGFEGIMVAIYGYDRPKMRCTSDYCHFSHPKQLLKAVGMRYSDYWYSIAILILIYIILDTCAFIILRLRLKQRFYR